MVTGTLGSKLAANATPAKDDKLYIIDDSAATGVQPSQAITLSDLFVINVTHYGAIGNGSTNDTTAIQDAIDAADSNGGGRVYIPANTYAATQIKMKSRVTLYGDGAGTILKQIANTDNTDFIILSDIEQVGCVVRDLLIDGNQSNQTTANTGITLDNTSGTTFIQGDHLHNIKNVSVVLTRGTGIEIIVSRECKLSNIFVNDTLEHGVLMQGTDCTLTAVTSGKTEKAGIYHASQNNKYVGCKAFDAGNSGLGIQDCFYISSDRGMFSSCEAQDGNRDGFRIEDGSAVKHITLSACIADSNNDDGFHITANASKITGVGLQAFTRSGAGFTQDRGIEIASGVTECNFSGHFEGGTEGVTNNGTGCRVLNDGVGQDANSITLDDTGTPSVVAANNFKTGGTTAITDFDDGVEGQTIRILAAHSIIITDGAPVALKNSTNFNMVAGDSLTLTMFNDQVWEEVSRSTTTETTEAVTATNVITAAESGKTFYLNTAGGFTSTLPAPAVGLKYIFIVSTAPTTAYIITTNSGTNVLYGTFLDIVGELVYFSAQDTLNFVASTSLVGDRLEVESDGTNWYCKAFSGANGGITVAVT